MSQDFQLQLRAAVLSTPSVPKLNGFMMCLRFTFEGHISAAFAGAGGEGLSSAAAGQSCFYCLLFTSQKSAF